MHIGSRRWRAHLAVGCVALLLSSVPPARTDDTDLLRKNTATPYVMLILDTSTSMNLTIGTNEWHPMNGDYERSKIYAAKKALYDIFKAEDGINFGFMTFNQDELHVQSKHFLYSRTQPQSFFDTLLLYPLIDSNGQVDAFDDVLTVGRLIPGEGGTLGVANTCATAFDLTNPEERAKASRFPKLGADGTSKTTMWVEFNGVHRRIIFSAPGVQAGSQSLGDPVLTIRMDVINTGDCNQGVIASLVSNLDFQRVGATLMDDMGDRFADDGAEGGGNDVEDHAGFWNWRGAFADTDCSSGSPFSGKGLEGNYDDPVLELANLSELSGVQKQLTSDDEFCSTSGSNPVCRNLKLNTLLDPVYPQFRELDRGDFIPFHWDISAKDDMLKRLNPNHNTGAPPDFGVANYFAHLPDGVTGNHALADPGRRPVVATGETPFAKAVNDYRCFYLGPNIGPAGKCRDGNSKISFTEGWQQVAKGRDPDYECRRPFVIMISDGEDTCGGENASADTADLDAIGTSVWVLNVGGREGEQSFQSILSNADAELITVDTGDQLRTALQDILGTIESEARSFTSAAVPSVQTEAEDKVVLTSFTPLNEVSTWAGSGTAILKPLEDALMQVTDPDTGETLFVPDPSRVCGPNDTEGCIVWDVGDELKQQVDVANPFGATLNQRRVFYSQASTSNAVPRVAKPFVGTTKSGSSASTDEIDFWNGLGLVFNAGVETSEDQARADANNVVDATYSLKTARTDPDDPASEITYILGETFHADPVVLGAPTSNLLFVQDYEGYRDFAKRHEFRRKLLVLAANDGMIHFFDAGVADVVNNEVVINNGTGREVLAYMPRGSMSKVTDIAQGTSHQWAVDGSLSVADVFLDPKHAGTPTANDREWRTVLVAGLRRGGESLYALDVTHPDQLEEVTLPGPPQQTVTVPKNANPIPDCWNATGTGDVMDCHDELTFATPLWEFDDTLVVGGQRVRLDEDGNQYPDLAQTWSRPNLGRMRLKVGGVEEDRFVAIFGGGIDPALKFARGDWLYIVDVETGQTIYKRRLEDPADPTASGGAAASEPAAVDVNQDGLLDRVYIPTLGGFVYRVDLHPASGAPDVPVLVDTQVAVESGGVITQVPVKRILDNAFKPRVVFDNVNSATGTRQPFYHRPSVIFTPRLSPNFTLALGDGDRENLWSIAPAPGRFYVFLDDTTLLAPTLVADDLEKITPGSATVNTDFLQHPGTGKRHGWVLELDQPNERVIADAFALSGVTVFSSYIPEVESVIDPNAPRRSNLRLCSRGGSSRLFGVLTTSGNGVLFENGVRTRAQTINTLASKAFADLATTKNKPGSPPSPTDPPEDSLPPDQQQIFDELTKLFPENCRFSSQRVDIKAVGADTRVETIAPVPICLIEKNWRDF